MFNEGHNGQTVRIAVGGKIEISLKSNPSTGYIWNFAAPGMEMTRDYIPDRPYSKDSIVDTFIGGGGIETFNCVASRAQICHLKAEYKRPFEKNKAPIRIFELTVVAE